MELNQTPVRTSRNFNINNIKLDETEIPSKIDCFQNISVTLDNEKDKISFDAKKLTLQYGLGEFFVNQVLENSNQNLKITVESKLQKNINIDFEFDDENRHLLENIEIIAKEGTKSTVIIKYKTEEDLNYYHNGIIKLLAEKNSEIDVIIVNFMNQASINLMSIENEIQENALVKYTLVDFGGKFSISNYYSNLVRKRSKK